MSASEAGFCDLPLLVVGLPAPVRECLRAAGVPFLPVEGGGRLRGRRGRHAQPRFVLYDSRDAGSRRDVEGLRSPHLVPIDVVACLVRAVEPRRAKEEGAVPSPADERRFSCSRMTTLLKQTVETAHGLWARVPAVPFPSHYDPLLWHPKPAELLAWGKVRARIRLEISRTSAAYRIVAAGDFGGFRPALELWRGGHVASFELLPGETTLPIAGLVYQQRSERASEPVPASRPDDSQITLNAGRVKPQSA